MTLLANIRVVVLADGLADFGASMLEKLGAEVLHDATEAVVANADILLDDRRTCPDRPDIDRLASTNDRLIHVVVTGWPETTPQRPATDLTLMAQSGLMTVTGTPDKPPLRLPGEQAYALTGIQVATAALMGLRARRRTGKGQRIVVSALQSAALANYREAVMYEWTGRIGTRRGNMLVRGKSGVRQIWPCADGFVTWSMIDNPNMMRALVGAMAAEGSAGELAEIDWDAILVADTDQEVIDHWQAIVADYFAAHTRAELAEMSLKQGWGLSPIIRLAEVPESPQMKARGVFGQGDSGHPPGPLFAVHGLEDPA